MLKLSKKDREILQGVKVFRTVAIGLIFFGIAGIWLGIYSIWFRPIAQDAMRIVVSLMIGSVVYIIMGWLLNRICQVLQKINDQIKNIKNND